MPPSVATIQYPRPDGVPAMPTTGLFNGIPAMEPWPPASPNGKTAPVAVASQ
jgi:hypothetical protein